MKATNFALCFCVEIPSVEHELVWMWYRRWKRALAPSVRLMVAPSLVGSVLLRSARPTQRICAGSGPWTTAEYETLLFAVFGSGVDDVTVSWFVMFVLPGLKLCIFRTR